MKTEDNPLDTVITRSRSSWKLELENDLVVLNREHTRDIEARGELLADAAGPMVMAYMNRDLARDAEKRDRLFADRDYPIQKWKSQDWFW